ncbi:MAG: hypothetical protein C5B52_15400 [Bacteroidetes bacterium]|nr:MAG: hypothetical protein C5B52_15400 [Bacteroidota bacterium]
MFKEELNMKLVGIITGLIFRINRNESIQFKNAVSEGIWDTFKEMGYEKSQPGSVAKAMHTPPKSVEEFLNQSK